MCNNLCITTLLFANFVCMADRYNDGLKDQMHWLAVIACSCSLVLQPNRCLYCISIGMASASSSFAGFNVYCRTASDLVRDFERHSVAGAHLQSFKIKARLSTRRTSTEGWRRDAVRPHLFQKTSMPVPWHRSANSPLQSLAQAGAGLINAHA